MPAATQNADADFYSVADGSYPLSSLQSEVWLAHRLAADPAELNVPATFALPATLNVPAFREAMRVTINDIDALRTRIVESGSRPRQLVAPQIDYELPIVQDTEERWLALHARRPFALDAALFDSALLQDPVRGPIWYWNQHHIVTDIWSIRLIARRVADVYDALRRGAPVPTYKATPYQEFVEVDARHADCEAECADEFWLDQLASPVDPPSLYGVRARGTGRPFRRTVALGRDRSHALRAACAEGRGSASRAILSTWLAAFAAYQHRVSGVERVVIGMPYHNREPRFRQTAGLFVRVLPLALDVTAASSFADLREQARSRVDAALAHAFESLPAGASRACHSSINLHTGANAFFDGVEVVPTIHFTGHMHEQVALEVQIASSGEITVGFDADGESIDMTRAPHAVNHLFAMLDACVTHPTQRIGEVPIVDEEERRQLAVWSRGPALTHQSTFLAAFEERVAAQPDAVAVADQAGTLSYAELSDAADRFAQWLHASGARPRTPVGVLMARRVDLAVAILGILKARCVYLPLDADAPAERLQFIVRDAGACFVLIDDHHHGACGASPDFTCIHAPSHADLASWHSPELLEAPIGDDPAYIIYTSGSTGTPKGVLVPHRGLANHAAAAAHVYGVSAADRVLQFSALHFDIAIEELFPTWHAGGAVVFRSDDLPTRPDRLLPFVREHQITVVDLPTAFWHVWVAALARERPETPDCLRLVIVGGEQPMATALAEWRAATAPSVRWINGYGPSETTVTATVHEACGAEDDPIPMGRPLPNVDVHVLDAHRQLCPPGVPGELYISGVNVALGYVRSPEATAKAFVRVADAPAYRTGDIVRFRSNGELEFLGRVDDQVKIRGYRIEPLEIESTLCRHPAVTAAAVIVTGDRGALDRRLVAYVAAAPGSEDDVLAYARARLPAYMVPSEVVVLDQLPLTSTGKVDKKALPSIRPRLRTTRPAKPRTLLEAQIAAVWAELLGCGAIGRDQSFLDLGGHSLSAVRMLLELGERIGREVPIDWLARDLTVADLADALMNDAAAAGRSAVVARPHGDGAACPIVFFHGDYGGAGFYVSSLVRLLPQTRPFVSIAPHGLDGATVPATIETMAHDRIRDLLDVVPAGPCVVGGFCNGGLVAWEIVDRLRRHGRNVRHVVLVDAMLRTRRFRAIGLILRMAARWRGRDGAWHRDAFVRWRDRQITMAQLLDRHGGYPERFKGATVFERAAFLCEGLRRKVRRTADAAEPRTESPSAWSDLNDRFPHIDREYGRAIEAYVPPRRAVPTTLLLSDDFMAMGAEEEWRPVATALEVRRVGGAHFDIVDRQLPRVAEVLETLAAGVDHDHERRSALR
jgi:aspartate racemase